MDDTIPYKNKKLGPYNRIINSEDNNIIEYEDVYPKKIRYRKNKFSKSCAKLVVIVFIVSLVIIGIALILHPDNTKTYIQKISTTTQQVVVIWHNHHDSNTDEASARLDPADAIPLHYELALEPHLDTFSFDGTITIIIQRRSLISPSLILHSGKNLRIHSVAFGGNNTQLFNEILQYDHLNDMIQIEYPEEDMHSKILNVTLRFSGELGDRMHGFYRSSFYDAESGEKKWLAVTDLEPAGARHVFPCFDEPSFKAPWHIRVAMPSTNKYAVLSNMHRTHVHKVEGSDMEWHEFAPSPPMASYLVAICVAPYVFVQTQTRRGIPVRVWARTKNEAAQYAAETAAMLIDAFEDAWGIPYTLSKLDLIAIPDFAPGAMENWGAITFRETALLGASDGWDGIHVRKYTASIIAHELAHQWFGNLVTPRWWDDLWLSEGAATWASYAALDWIHPEWASWDDFYSGETMHALDADVHPDATHALGESVVSVEQAMGRFDTITYAKGAVVLRMLETAPCVGSEVFKNSIIHTYLQNRSGGSADLSALGLAVENGLEYNGTDCVNATRFLKDWTRRPGYPFISVNGTFVRQIRSNKKNKMPRTPWAVPLKIVSLDKDELYATTTEAILFKNKTMDIHPKSIVVPTQYSVTIFEQEADVDLVIRAIASKRMLVDDADAAALFISIIAVSEADKSAFEYDVAIIIRAFEAVVTRHNNNNPPLLSPSLWKPVLRAATKVSRVFPGGWKDGVCPLLESVLQNAHIIQEDTSSPPERSARVSLLRVAIRCGYLSIKDTADHPDTRALSQKARVASGEISVETVLFTASSKTTTNVSERASALAAVAYALPGPQRQSVLNAVLDVSRVRPQDTVSLLLQVAGARDDGFDVVWAFFTENYEKIYDHWSGPHAGVDRLIGGLLAHIADKETYKNVSDFFNAHPLKSASGAIQTGLVSAKTRVKWANRLSF